MTQIIKSTIGRCLKEYGFSAKDGSWYSETEDTILVVNLQKSQYGRSFYLNFAVWVKKLCHQVYPKEHVCHIRTRICSRIGEELQVALNEEDAPMEERERVEIIEGIMKGRVIPFILSCGTIESLKLAMAQGQFESDFVHPDVSLVLA